MNQQQIDASRREFDKIDTDHDGFITMKEAVEWGRAQGQEFEEIFERHMRQDQRRPDMRVDFEEFLRYKVLTSSM
ncbi:hypothetical protein ACQP1O_21525 [Nocardia sp. CA-151230]|uniref:hypothetical protein n=1 Tax=Nocardia sp. CA-151230 TaxID=3239982 RepID=UPI003D8F1BD3